MGELRRHHGRSLVVLLQVVSRRHGGWVGGKKPFDDAEAFKSLGARLRLATSFTKGSSIMLAKRSDVRGPRASGIRRRVRLMWSSRDVGCGTWRAHFHTVKRSIDVVSASVGTPFFGMVSCGLSANSACDCAEKRWQR